MTEAMFGRVFAVMIACVSLFGVMAAARPTRSTNPIADDADLHVKAAVARSATWLKARADQHHQPGQLALMVHALAKIHQRYPDIVADTDPVLAWYRAVRPEAAYDDEVDLLASAEKR